LPSVNVVFLVLILMGKQIQISIWLLSTNLNKVKYGSVSATLY